MSERSEGFPSFLELQRRHDELLERQAEFEGVPDTDARDFWAEAQNFVARAQRAGALLDTPHDRRAAQSILNYWANSLYRAGYDTPSVYLAVFDPTLAPALPDSPAPYRGLLAFGLNDRDFFFGRVRLIEDLIARVARGDRFLAIVGTSGSGKSSVVLAGLVSVLAGGEPFGNVAPIIAVLTPGAKPLQSLAHILVQTLQRPQRMKEDSETIAFVLLEADLTDDLPSVLQRIDNATDAPFVLVVDQFEELFTLCEDEAERNAFVDSLIAFSQNETLRHIVVITMRSDFVDNVVRLPRLDPLFRAGRVDVYPLNINELRAVIEGPAGRVGLQFDEGIIDDLISKILGERAGLPLLQFTLTKLWENRQRNRITRQIYGQVGHPLQALERSAESFYQSLLPEERITLRRILLKMVHWGEGQEVTSRRVPLEEIFQDGEARERVERVLDRLITKERLVKLSAGPRQTQDVGAVEAGVSNGEIVQVEIVHEALIRNWPRLVGWLEDERHRVRRRQQITEAALQWERLNRDAGALYSNTLLAEARRVVQESNQLLTSLEDAFLEASQGEIDREREEEIDRRVELARTQELAAQQTQYSRRLRLLSILLFLMSVFIGIIAYDFYIRLSDWVPVANLPGDAITRLAVAVPTDRPPRYCIGTIHMGVACSTDGITWNIYQANLPTGGLEGESASVLRGVNALAIDAADPDLLYVFLWEKGIYKSDDGGINWQSANKSLIEDAVITLAARGGAVAAIIQEAKTRARSLYISLDAGGNWHLMTEFTIEGYGIVNDVAFVSATAGTELILLVATDTGIYASPVQKDWMWQQIIDLPFSSLLAVGDALDDGFYIVTAAGREQSKLFFWQSDKSLQNVAAFEREVRSLAANPNADGLQTAYLLLDNNEVIAVQPTGKRQSLGKPPASLLDGELDYAFRIAVFPDKAGQSIRLWLAHTKGLFERKLSTTGTTD